jgi:hypothetical protein
MTRECLAALIAMECKPPYQNIWWLAALLTKLRGMSGGGIGAQLPMLHAPASCKSKRLCTALVSLAPACTLLCPVAVCGKHAPALRRTPQACSFMHHFRRHRCWMSCLQMGPLGAGSMVPALFWGRSLVEWQPLQLSRQPDSRAEDMGWLRAEPSCQRFSAAVCLVDAREACHEAGRHLY